MHFVRNHLLLLSLIILVLLDPLIEDFSYGGAFSISLLGVSSGLCLWVLSEKKLLFIFMIIFTILVIAFDIFTMIYNTRPGEMVATLSQAFLTFTFAMLMFYYMLVSRTLSFSDLSNAISIYFLLGIGYGFVYSFAEILHPGSFVFNNSTEGEASSDLIYFSFVTLTTAGFGDITPVNKFVKTIVILEMVNGVMYVAITIGKLVGLGSDLKSNIQNNENPL
jgi:hypothetical protein